MSSQKYRELEQLLKAQEWRKADELTAKLMCQVAGREKEGWLNTESIEAFPCEDLRTIDQLWVHYSNGKFGFSVQKKLWLECGGKIGNYEVLEVWRKFGAKVGWYHPKGRWTSSWEEVNEEWLATSEFMNDTQNAQKFLPASLPVSGLSGGGCVGGWWVWVGCGAEWRTTGLAGIFSRAETCEL